MRCPSVAKRTSKALWPSWIRARAWARLDFNWVFSCRLEKLSWERSLEICGAYQHKISLIFQSHSQVFHSPILCDTALFHMKLQLGGFLPDIYYDLVKVQMEHLPGWDAPQCQPIAHNTYPFLSWRCYTDGCGVEDPESRTSQWIAWYRNTRELN